jgi:hypothetical protein
VNNTRKAEYFAFLLSTEGTGPGHRKDQLAWQTHKARARQPVSRNPTPTESEETSAAYSVFLHDDSRKIAE